MDELTQKHPLALAFIGDAVMNLLVKEQIVTTNNTRVNDLHKQASAILSAKAQAVLYDKLPLTQAEREVATRAFNAKHNTVPKNCTLAEYRSATALEAVIGYNWLLGNRKRVEELIK